MLCSAFYSSLFGCSWCSQPVVTAIGISKSTKLGQSSALLVGVIGLFVSLQCTFFIYNIRKPLIATKMCYHYLNIKLDLCEPGLSRKRFDICKGACKERANIE